VIVGVGIDVAEIDRFAKALERTPELAERLFVDAELWLPSGERRGVASLAARFAAKEALAKALGAPGGMSWTEAVAAGTRDGGGTRRVAGCARVASVAVARRGGRLGRGDRGGLITRTGRV
jgi:holo-[acyl-carrier protein] synthase